MATFPRLNTGAVSQYPTTLTVGQGVAIIRFIDGSDQRFLNQGRQYRRWKVDLTLLNDQEIHQLEQFFVSQQGEYSAFVFPDPISGTDVLNCRIGEPELGTVCTGTDVNSSTMWIIETNG
jgi:hypothetical protein